MTSVFLLLISVALSAFVAGQLVLKKGMEQGEMTGFRSAPFLKLLALGVIAMSVHFFLTLGLLQRHDLSYLYPFQGLSVIMITLTAAWLLKEALTARLLVGSLLLSAGVILVSLT